MNNKNDVKEDATANRLLDLEVMVRKSELRLTFYMFLALTGWAGVVALLFQRVIP